MLITGLLLRVWRWRHLVAVGTPDIDTLALFRSYMSGQLLNWYFPGRMGDISRVYHVGQTGKGNSFSLGTIVVEKLMDLIAFAGLFFLVMLSYPLPVWIRSAAGMVGLFGLFAILGMIGLVRVPDRFVNLLRLLLRWIPEALQSRFVAIFKSGISSLDVIRDWQGALSMIVLTGVIWLFSILTNYFLLFAFSLRLEWISAVILLVALQAGITLPGAPGRFGVFQYICILVLGLFQVDQATSLSYGITLQAVVLLPVTILGSISMIHFAYQSMGVKSEPAATEINRQTND